MRTDGKTGIDRHRTCLGCRLGRFAAERHWRSLAPRHAPRASVSPTAITKNSATANAVALFLAGAEGLEPSARGFGVDVGRKQGKKKWRSRGVCQGEEGDCGAELVLKAGAGQNIARTLREEKSDIGKPIVRA